MSNFVDRRSFLQAAALAPAVFTARSFGADGAAPSERIRIGVIGVGNQGRGNMKRHLRDVVAVCEVDETRLGEAAAAVEKETKRKPATFRDYRKLLESKDIDAVVITTPDHWHAMMTIDACRAGKDVYVEKPLTLTVAEGRAMVAAARKHGRIVQTGSQQRSDSRFRQAAELVRNGKLGKIKLVKVGIPGVNFKGPAVPNAAPPAELDYNLWLGPAPERPYNVNRVHYNFRFFWDYSGGQMTNFGAHHLDIAQWALGMDDTGPVEIEGQAKFHPEKWYEVPSWCEAKYRYANGVEMVCGQSHKGGVTFEGEKGTLFVDRGKITCDPADILKQSFGDGDTRLYVSKDHHANWLECLRTRKTPICDVEIGHRSATVCHLGNIAVRLGRKISFDPASETIGDDKEAAAMLTKPYRGPWKLA